MAEDKEVVIRITGRNLTPAAFDQARQQLSGLKEQNDKTKKSSEGLSLSFDSLKKAAGLLGVGLGIGAVVSFGRSVLQLASEVSDTAKRFGVSTETIQRWTYAAEQSGGSVGTLERNLINLNKAISGGSDSTRALLAKLGLDLDDLKLMDRATAFETVADAIGRAENPTLQVQAAIELLGRSGVENLPTFMAGLAEIGAKAPVMADDTVQALARASGAWQSLGSTVKVVGGNILADLITMVTANKNLSDEERLRLNLEQRARKTVGAAREEALEQLGKLNEKTKEAAVPVKQLTDAERVHAAALSVTRDATTELDASMRADIQTMIRSGATRAQIIKSLTEAEVETDRYEAAIDAMIKAQKDDEKATKERRDALANLHAALAPVTAKERERIQIALNWFSVNGKLLVSEKDLAQAYGFSEQSIKLVIAANKARADTEQAQDTIRKKIAADNAKLRQEEVTLAWEVADAHAQALVETVGASRSAHERIVMSRLSMRDQVLASINLEEQREIAALGRRTVHNAQFYDRAKIDIEAFYQDQRDLAHGTADTITIRMERMGIDTRASLRATAEAAGIEFDQMRLSGEYTGDQLIEKWKEYHTEAAAASTGVEQVFHLTAANIDQYGTDLILSLKGGWESFKSVTMRILDDILGQFVNVFVKGLIGSALNVQNAWGTAFGAIVSGASTTASAGAGAATASGAAATAAASSAASALGAIAGALGPVAAIIYGVSRFTGGSTPLGREIPLETSPDMTDEERQEFLDAGGDIGGLPPPDGGWEYDEWAAAHGFARGGMAEGRQLAILAERGQREIVGSVSFMTEALIGALNRTGGASLPARGMTAEGTAPNIYIAIDRSGRVALGRAEFAQIQRQIDGGVITIPAASIHRRSA